MMYGNFLESSLFERSELDDEQKIPIHQKQRQNIIEID